MRKPLCVDLFCGLGGWTRGFIKRGWNCAGFDIERHVYGTEQYPADLVIQDVLTIHGKQFKEADCIVASPPCTEFSWMAMPWSRAKQVERALLGQDKFPPNYLGSRTIGDLTALFNACFRIQKEASAAAGLHIPMVVENVRGANKWVGRARHNFGSYYLWGDVPALMPIARRVNKGRSNFHFYEKTGLPSPSFHGAEHEASVRTTAWAEGEKGVPHRPTGHWTNPAENGSAQEGYKSSGLNWSNRELKGQDFTRRAAEATKCGGDWFGRGDSSPQRMGGSKSNARKAASALIARIPERLSDWVAEVYFPKEKP